MNIPYTAEAVVQGRRAGHGRTTDGRLGVDLSVPPKMGAPGGPGNNPEQLFAVRVRCLFSVGAVVGGRRSEARRL